MPEFLLFCKTATHFKEACRAIVFKFSTSDKILVTSFGCWCPTLMLKDRECW